MFAGLTVFVVDFNNVVFIVSVFGLNWHFGWAWRLLVLFASV